MSENLKKYKSVNYKTCRIFSSKLDGDNCGIQYSTKKRKKHIKQTVLPLNGKTASDKSAEKKAETKKEHSLWQ
ncbi:MAG: hypothetical protein DUD27_09340 [Lachnospiraceae bacterium]|uniref:Uncharacterized protein n=1 Tax=Candidatus Weimeria bifida TaxID=2599074 RepID=A0A6N7IWT5_9FIRM|nr:hypothetical protein [Candidatus Weimeria bifida]RRF94545.1 MAG: hypothetical protein DUD27_09340 [Lachnospiraceae bacterium]